MSRNFLYYNYYNMSQVKRKDYRISQIEKKYTDLELSQLLLFNSIFNYPPVEYDPDKECDICMNKPITKEFQLSENIECLDCYEKIKKKNYEYILKFIAKEHFAFEGNCILENKLYLGDIKSSFLKNALKEKGITHILMVGYFMTPIFPEDFIYENIEINDNISENILKYFVKGIKFIDQSKICFTHCQLGKSRSAAVVMAYVMYKNKMHFSEAFDFVRKKRPIAFPNDGFQWQLEDFDIILNNFNYDLDKCDDFIQKFFENRESLKVSQNEFLKNQIIKLTNNEEISSEDADDEKDEEKKKEKEKENKKEEEKKEKKEEKKEDNKNHKSKRKKYYKKRVKKQYKEDEEEEEENILEEEKLEE